MIRIMIMMIQKSLTMLITLETTILMTTMMTISRRIQSQDFVHFQNAVEDVAVLYPAFTFTKWLRNVFLLNTEDAGETRTGS